MAKTATAKRGLQRGDTWAKTIIRTISLTCILVNVFIVLFLVFESLPVLGQTSLHELLFSPDWYPNEDPPALGMLPLWVASLLITLFSSLLALPASLVVAIFIAEIAPRKLRTPMKTAVELLGFMPSIVLGFFGMVIFAPWLQERLDLLAGLNFFNASLLLGALALPTVAALSEEALRAVPQELRDASYALGATRLETIRHVVLPAAKPRLLSAGLLGVMRSLGETMVVLMAAGGAAVIPHSLFDPVRPLPAAIAAEMGETAVGSPHYHTLFFAGLLLLLITLALSALSRWIETRGEKPGASRGMIPLHPFSLKPSLKKKIEA